MFGFVKQHAHSEECTAKETTEFLFREQDHLMFISNNCHLPLPLLVPS